MVFLVFRDHVSWNPMFYLGICSGFIPAEKCHEPEKGWWIAHPFFDPLYDRILEYRRSDRKYTYTELTQHTFGYIFSDAGIIRASGRRMEKTGTLV